MRRTYSMSFLIRVLRLRCSCSMTAPSSVLVAYASAASCTAASADGLNRAPVFMLLNALRTARWNGAFLMSSAPDFWILRISRRATVPGLYRRLPPPFFDDFVFFAFTLGLLPPADFLADALVRAISLQHGQQQL
eukprot:gene6995-gene570